ncbi:MAG: hypothetical protein ACO2ZM_06240 [Francisellaceae bacterium]
MMFYDPDFTPLHINATHEDMKGNNGHGRYLFVPGSNSRARQISDFFNDVTAVRRCSRGHDLYLGTITRDGITIDVGAISTGMGTPSVDIILNELLKLGGRKFLRLGTCGLLQPEFMKGGDLAIATAAVRDDHATRCYVPSEYPATVAYEMQLAASMAVANSSSGRKAHFGLVHTKSSLYAREFRQGALAGENSAYMDMLTRAGVIASEMEAAMLFVLANMADSLRKDRDPKSPQRVFAGTMCAVLGEGDDFGDKAEVTHMIEDLIELGIATFIELNKMGY